MSFMENREFLEQYYINYGVNIGHGMDMQIIERIVLSLTWVRWYHKGSQQFCVIWLRIFKFVLLYSNN